MNIERTYFQINEDLAREANRYFSNTEYKEGSLTAEYKGYCDKMYDFAEKAAKERPEEKNKIHAIAVRYAKRMADNLNRKKKIQCMCPSEFIMGSGNFPVDKKAKQDVATDNNYREFDEIQKMFDRIQSIVNGKSIIKSSDADAVEKLEKKLAGLKEKQEKMKSANKAIRMKNTEKGNALLREMGYTDEQIGELRKPDFCGRVGFPSCTLTNNNQNIHRVENRLKALKAAKEQENTESENEYFRVVENTEIMRLQLFFDGKPDSATRDLLKRNGFRWSPRNECWQRQLTNNARYATKQVLKSLEGES